MTWELFFENWHKIVGMIVLLASVIISPIVLIRWLRTRNELSEIQTFIKKNRVIREEIARINEELDSQASRIRALEMELHDEKLHNRALTAENEQLKKSNQLLKQKLEACENK
jgi:septal ring factor EnvC (AmiA/AmiB activator)